MPFFTSINIPKGVVGAKASFVKIVCFVSKNAYFGVQEVRGRKVTFGDEKRCLKEKRCYMESSM